VACLSSVLTSGSARLGLSALPHFPKLRLIIFVSLAAALFSLLVVFLNISHLHALLPMDYAKMQTVIYLLLGLSYLAASSLVLSVVLAYQEATPDSPPPSTRHHLLASSVLGYLCGLQSLVCSCHSLTSRQMDKKLEQSSTQFTLQTAAASRAVTSDTIAARPPPAPRPIVRSQGQAGHPPLGLSNQNYSPPPGTKHQAPRHLQHNHYGGRGGGPPYPHKRSASPDTPPALHRSYPSSPRDPGVDPGDPVKERLKGLEHTSIHPADGPALTGAIPKKRKKTGPNPSLYPDERPHPDEIICVSMEDVEDVEQQRKQQQQQQSQHKHLPNFAH